MPDWLTHVLLAWIIIELFGLKGKYKPIIFIGAVLPDIDKIFFFISDSTVALYPSLQFLISHGITHTLAILLLAVFTASFFEGDMKNNSLFMSLGAISHLILDSFTTGSGIMWLWPLSWERFTYPLFWSDLVVLPFVMLFWLGLIKFFKGNLANVF